MKAMRIQNMKTMQIKLVASLLTGVLLLGACGGGDDDAGSLTPFSIVPATITVTGPDANTCGAGSGGQVFVYGGAAPYRLDNTSPDAIVLSTNSVGARGGSFEVFFLGQCVNPVQVVVVDHNDKQVTLTLISKKGS
jgi:hypothetical protein